MYRNWMYRKNMHQKYMYWNCPVSKATYPAVATTTTVIFGGEYGQFAKTFPGVGASRLTGLRAENGNQNT